MKTPRHAKSWGDGASIRKELDKERRKSIKGFKEDVVKDFSFRRIYSFNVAG